MSFDWLNVPGLDLSSGDQAEKRPSNGLGPPSVSFDFGINTAAPHDSSFWDQGSRSHSDTTLSYTLSPVSIQILIPAFLNNSIEDFTSFCNLSSTPVRPNNSRSCSKYLVIT